MIYIKSCYKCHKRTPICHSNGETYAGEKAAGLAKKALIQKAKAEEAAVRGARQHSYEVRKHGG